MGVADDDSMVRGMATGRVGLGRTRGDVREHARLPARFLRDSDSRLAGGVKTRYLYGMGARLVNVRLDADRLRKARTLRERGVALSDVVREAIDERFAELRQPDSQLDVRTIVRRIFEQYPDPPDLPPRDYNVHDHRAARAAIRGKRRPARP